MPWSQRDSGNERKFIKTFFLLFFFFCFVVIVVLRKNIKMNQLHIFYRQIFNVIPDFCLIECCSILFAIFITLALSVRSSISELPKLHPVSDSFGSRCRHYDSNLIIFRCRCVCLCVLVVVFNFPALIRSGWLRKQLR